MKKVLTILTTIVLGSNTALLVTKPIDQGQKLDGIEGSPIFAQTITKNDNLIKDNSKQLTAVFIRLLALLVKKLQIFVKKILIEKYNFN
ncbi:hypothetical protein D6D54_02890 [Spiroplasma poulsonii]|uniref:Uncharacterized protein n=1 Tax=Spiroplasma poulsonii TaxID=2138 RepID=A0A433ES37_9MOLU|nr:hypothetical protein [Spiroplasma poulsonii]MBW3058373.1 hypothetical protein [Spiroplasma poulsonii]RUP77520.1 hypothetical protein D6D54_02890 [Spiroplasma poulsonii]